MRIAITPPTPSPLEIDLTIAIACCNCAIAIVVLAIALWARRFRRSASAFAECCDRWERDSARVLGAAPEAIDRSIERIERIRQLYRYHSIAIEQIQGWRLFLGIARSVIFKRRFRG